VFRPAGDNHRRDLRIPANETAWSLSEAVADDLSLIPDAKQPAEQTASAHE
jgi:hypothetical protein